MQLNKKCLILKYKSDLIKMTDSISFQMLYFVSEDIIQECIIGINFKISFSLFFLLPCGKIFRVVFLKVCLQAEHFFHVHIMNKAQTIKEKLPKSPLGWNRSYNFVSTVTFNIQPGIFPPQTTQKWDVLKLYDPENHASMCIYELQDACV